VAALLDTDIGTAESKAEQLVDAHLVDYTYVDHAGQVRYRVHDLVRIYARERAEEAESRADRIAYTARVAGGRLWLVQQLTDHIADHVTSGAIVLSPTRRSTRSTPTSPPPRWPIRAAGSTPSRTRSCRLQSGFRAL
jgi:hypothetical protein